MKKTTAVETLAQLKLESIQKRKAFWKESLGELASAGAAFVIVALIILIVVGGWRSLLDAENLKPRISALETVNAQDPSGFRISMLDAEIARLNRRIDALPQPPLPVFNATNIIVWPTMTATNCVRWN